jgi:heme/copper-type cytochrome/quinol oxidase subunit 1
VPFLGLAAVLVGGLIAYLNRDFVGWFAYAPLSNKPFSANGAAFITQGTQAGLAIMVSGLLVLAFWAGYRMGVKGSPADGGNT